ncbi:MAG: SCO family protein [Bdellovibrionota bacterium]
MHLRELAFALILSLGALHTAVAYTPPTQAEKAGTDSHATPEELADVGVTEHLSQKLSNSLEFTDDAGKKVTLGQYFNGQKPVLFTMVYYNCPSLCNYHLNGLLDVFHKAKMTVGKDFDLVAVSMNHNETPELAAKKKINYLKELNQPGAEKGWHFLVGTEENVLKLAGELGFRFKWNEAGQQYAHAAVAYVLTPQGVISRYLYGIEFPPQTLRLSLIEASQGKIGNIIDQIVLFCFQFNPSKNKYTLAAFNVMRLGGALTALLLAAFLVPYWRRERRLADRTSLSVKGDLG